MRGRKESGSEDEHERKKGELVRRRMEKKERER